MKLLIIAHPVQALILRVYEDIYDFNERPAAEWNCWYDEFYTTLGLIRRNFSIDKISIYGNKQYSDRIKRMVESVFEDIEIERIEND